ncbi:hypothetical protein B0H10DRAFT_1966441 [Mycena sp. CBHHK59/15]|nr:hypothetical protein B0H10DRAFT_1966441 [Mycena sp. CBHHK59/15]
MSPLDFCSQPPDSPSSSTLTHPPAGLMDSPIESVLDDMLSTDYLALYWQGDLEARHGHSGVWELHCSTCRQWICTSVPFNTPYVDNPSEPMPVSGSSALVDEDVDMDDFQFQINIVIKTPEALPNNQPGVAPIVVQCCPGMCVHWPVKAGPFNETFPFHRIGITPSSLPFIIEMHNLGTVVIAFSRNCTREAHRDRCCEHCAKVPRQIAKLVDMAIQAESCTNHGFLNWSQIKSLLEYHTEEVCHWRLKTTNISWMRWVVGNCCMPLTMAWDFLLLHTLHNHMAFTKIMPTVGNINVADIIHNIREVLLKPREAASKTELHCVSLLIDKVALEERAVHFCHNNSIGGLCWRHSSILNLCLNSYDAAVNISMAIKAGKVHLGKEMTVVTASCFGKSGTYPIMALTSCKQSAHGVQPDLQDSDDSME